MTVILFDLEGTLVRSDWEEEEYVKEFRRRLRSRLIDLGIPSGILKGMEKSTLMRNKASEYVQVNFTTQRAKQFQVDMEKFLREHELKAARSSRLCPEAIPTLKLLKMASYKLGLVTNTSKEALRLIFDKHELKGYFDIIVTREDVDRLKPNPKGVLLALKKLRDKDFFLVGDQNHDALAAKNAGGISIIVERAHTNAKFEKPSCDYKVASLSGIISLLIPESGRTMNTKG